jgi:hypothetical protein
MYQNIKGFKTFMGSHDGVDPKHIPEWQRGGYVMLERDYSDLDSRYAKFYESGERVEVELEEGWEMYVGHGCVTNGRKLRFYVGRSTGRKPIYLMILKRNSSGGMGVPTSGVKSIKGLGIFK